MGTQRTHVRRVSARSGRRGVPAGAPDARIASDDGLSFARLAPTLPPSTAAFGTPSSPMHCSHPEHDHASADMLGRVEHACAERGLRLTELRRRVFELIADSTRPVKAYDLLEKVRKQGAGPTAPPTVYRALDFLMSHGFVHRLETLNAYVPCPHPEAEAHGSQFLICENCQETLELDAGGIADRLRAQAKEQGFEPRRHTIEVYGLCARCSSGH